MEASPTTVWHETSPISWRPSSTPIECTSASSLNVQWKASTADPLFTALQATSTWAHHKIPRGIKRAVLQDWNSPDSPGLKRARFEDSGVWAAPASLPQEQQHCGSLSSKRGLCRDDDGARKGVRLSPPSRLQYMQNNAQPLH